MPWLQNTVNKRSGADVCVEDNPDVCSRLENAFKKNHWRDMINQTRKILIVGTR